MTRFTACTWHFYFLFMLSFLLCFFKPGNGPHHGERDVEVTLVDGTHTQTSVEGSSLFSQWRQP